ncbi:MAG: recombinase family protein [Clostridiales bacterium]|nr:recombinase family protein [Clostridiales bacterium]
MDSIYTIGIYLRISKEDEGEEFESNSIRNQRELLTRFIRQKPEFESCKVLEFIDDGYSGTNFHRPGIQRLLLQVKRKEIHCILVKDFSRFGRNYIEVGDYLEQIFPFIGVRFISINDGYDNAKADEMERTLDIAIKNLIYDLYSKDLSKKIISALEIKKIKGDFLGSSPPYGYEKNKDNRNLLVIDKEAAKVIKRIYKLTLEGEKRAAIARQLNQEGVATPGEYLRIKNNHTMWKFSEQKAMWTAQTIGRILRNPIYIGSVTNNKYKRKEIGSSKRVKVSVKEWKICKEIHKPIITRNEFILVQNTFQTHKDRKVTSEKEYPLSGILRCGNCKHLMERRNIIYYCDYKRFNGSNHCMEAVVEENEIVDAILFILKQYSLLASDEKVSNVTSIKIKDINIFRMDNKNHINRQIKRWKTAYLDCYEDYKRERISLEGYAARKKEINNILHKLKEEQINLLEINAVDYVKKDLYEKDKKEILQETISTVWVYSPDRIEIAFLT